MNPAIFALAHTIGVGEPPSVDLPLDERPNWEVVTTGTSGLLVLQADAEGRAWTFSRFDASLRPQWKKEWTAPADAELQTWASTPEAVWVLMYERERGVVDLTRISLADGTTKVVSAITPAVAPYMVDMRIQGDTAWVLTADAQPIAAAEGQLLRVDLKNGRVDNIDVGEKIGAPGTPMFQPFSDSGGGTDLVAVTRRAGHNRVDVFRLGERDIEGPLSVPAVEGHNVVVAHRHTLSDQSQLLLGNYDEDDNGQSAQGLFFSHWKDGAEQFRTFTNYSELTHFYDSLPARQREWVRASISRKRSRQRDFDFPWVVSIDAVEEHADRYLVVAEAWLPQYERQTRTNYEVVRGRPVGTTRSVQVFSGWLLTHAIVLSFDKQGTLMWDRSVTLGETLADDLAPRVQVGHHGENLELNWSRGGTLHWATVDTEGNFLTMDEHEAVDPTDATIVARRTQADSTPWFVDTFASWSVESEGMGAERTEVLRLRRVEP